VTSEVPVGGIGASDTGEIISEDSRKVDPCKTGALQSAIFNSANFSSIATDAKGVTQIFNVRTQWKPTQEPASGFPSARRSWSATAVGSGWNRNRGKDRRSVSASPQGRRIPVDKYETRGKPIEILLVEDNPGDVRLTREALKDANVLNTLHVARDGEEAMDFICHGGKHADAPRPDLVLPSRSQPAQERRQGGIHRDKGRRGPEKNPCGDPFYVQNQKRTS
jgi:hypothetical protein